MILRGHTASLICYILAVCVLLSIGCLVSLVTMVDKLHVILRNLIQQVLIAALMVCLNPLHHNLIPNTLLDDFNCVFVIQNLGLSLELVMLLLQVIGSLKIGLVDALRLLPEELLVPQVVTNLILL